MKVFGKEIGKAIKFPPFIDEFVGKLLPNHSNEEMVTVPSVNISDEDKAFELSIALPGMDKKDVKIEVQGNTLIISCKKMQSEELKEKHWVRQEYVRNTFYKAFNLPLNADIERINAKMKNGLLQVKIAKKESVNKKRRLEVA